MKLYLLKRLDDFSYDEYDSAIVAAKNADDAETIHPSGREDEPTQGLYSTWTNQAFIDVTEIGTAKPGTKRGVILASFNAG